MAFTPIAQNPRDASGSVMATLRLMKDDELQQYANLHKNDPYIFPLAFQESQTRKQVRAEAQAAQAAQNMPQGKVVDQDLAMMAPAPQMPQQMIAQAPQPLPENVGIGALPAKNLQGLCGGGIVAFDEGGEVPRYQNQGLVQTPPSAGTPFDIPGMISGSPILPQAGYKDPSEMTTWEKIQAYRHQRQAERAAYQRGQQAPATAAYTPSTVDPFAYDQASFPMPQSAAPKTEKAAPTNTPGADKYAPTYPSSTGMRPGGGLGLTAIPGLTTTATGTMAELQAMRDQMGPATLSTAQQEGINALAAETKAAKEAELSDLQADIAARGPGMVGAETRAKAREEKLTKRETDLPGLAMFEAGMAIMAGESPFALVNIGRGAGIGMKSYTAGLEKLQEARDKLDESFDKIEQFRENRADMNAKEVRAAKAGIRQTQVDAKRMVYDALSKNTDMDRQDIRAAYQTMASNRAEMYKVAANYDLGIQQIAAQRDIAGQRNALYEKLHGGDLKAREEFGRIQRAVMQSLDKNPLYTNEPNENKKAIMFNTAMQQAMQNNPYLAPAAFGIGFSKTPPPGAKEVFDMTP